jgi:DNA-directed RNA polymerase subunit RPC12/RpoP
MDREYRMISENAKCPRCGRSCREFEKQDDFKDIYIVCDYCGLNQIDNK